MYCSRCGTKMADDVKFCPNCGLPMAGANPPASRDEEWDAGRGKKPTGKGKKPKRQGAKIAVIVVLVLLVVLGAAGGAVYLLSRDDGAAEEADAAVSESAETQSTASTQSETDKAAVPEDEDTEVGYKTLSLPATCTHTGTSGYTVEYAYEWSDNTLTKTWYAENEVWYEYVYDSDENLLSRTSYEESDDGSWWEKYIFTYTYDSWGNVLTMSQTCYWYEDGEYGSEGPEMMYEFEHICDEAGNCLNSILYYPDGTIGRKDEYIYDETGNCLSKICYDSDDVVIYWYEYTYDEAGNCLTEIWYNSDGTVENGYECTYDADGNRLTSITYNYDGTEDRYEYTYLTMEVAVTE